MWALGAVAVPAKLHKLGLVHRPTWRRASDQYAIRVSAELRTGKHGTTVRCPQSAEPLQHGYWVRFTAIANSGIPSTDHYRVQWRVANTDKSASKAGVLRGDFYPSDEGAFRSERLEYRGVHFVEAFLIRKRDDLLVGQSDPFYAVIE